MLYGIGFLLGGALGSTTGAVDPSALPANWSPASPSLASITLFDILGVNLLNGLLMAVGAVFFGTLTVVLGFQNGFAHGVVVGTSLVESGSPGLVALLFLPHAAIELPAIWLALAAGLRPVGGFLAYLRSNRADPIRRSDIEDAIALFLIAELLILVAAFIEYFVTLRLARSLV
ncbi:stage II sporulation protein M [Haloarcula amylovorans]|uniref:stage II sporulation protein M n=1 Tax=Haloarcula amylovorans TaxID=2562280 RepID=UPI001431D03E|nr:stage II sporulation protein M [Halomicroarcula amylolytica]